jgi:hypothetical protein
MAGLIILLTLLLWIWGLQKAKERHRNLQEAVQSPSTADLQCPKLQQLPPIIIMQPDNEVIMAASALSRLNQQVKVCCQL